jgi:large subunit ribosomal protein L18e
MQVTKRTGPTNILIRMTIRKLRKASRENGARIWRYVAELIGVPRRRRIVVNLSKINRHTEPNDVVVVPGKVLGAGRLDHPVTVAALGFSAGALEAIRKAGGRAVHILQLVEENPKGSGVKILV